MMRHSFANKTKALKNVWVGFAISWLVLSLRGDAPKVPNGRDLVARSLEAGERNEQQLASYVSRTRSSTKQLAQDGSIKSQETKTFDDVVVDGFHVRSLIAKDDKPLTGADRGKEEARVAKLVAQRKRESPQARVKRLEEAKVKREKDHRFSREMLDAFDFRVTGEETLGGRKTWILDATPHPGYQPKELKAQMFPHLRGRIWIDAEDLLWTKAEADAFDQFSIGFSVVARLDKGAHLLLEQVRQADGTWLVRQVGLRATGRLALVKHFSIDNVTVSESFRKIAPEQRIGDGKDDF